MAAAPDGAVLYPWAAGPCCRGRGRRQSTVESYRRGRALPLRCGWLNIRTLPMPDSTPRIEQQPAPRRRAAARAGPVDGGAVRPAASAALAAKRSVQGAAAATWDLSERRATGSRRRAMAVGSLGPQLAEEHPAAAGAARRAGARGALHGARRAPRAAGQLARRLAGTGRGGAARRRPREGVRAPDRRAGAEPAATGARRRTKGPGATSRAICTASAARRCRSRRWWAS